MGYRGGSYCWGTALLLEGCVSRYYSVRRCLGESEWFFPHQGLVLRPIQVHPSFHVQHLAG